MTKPWHDLAWWELIIGAVTGIIAGVFGRRRRRNGDG